MTPARIIKKNILASLMFKPACNITLITLQLIGKRLVAKIKDGGSAFSQDEIYSDFSKVFRLYTIKNKNLGMFFLRETKDNLNQPCDDFERSLKKEGENG